jgi:CRISPR/Cas system CMR subunit Cmr4 (Cas7 group RAMP superfamily)
METIEEFNKEIDQRFEALTEKNESVRDLVSSINVDKIENIKQVIEEINELILERTELSNLLFLVMKHYLAESTTLWEE